MFQYGFARPPHVRRLDVLAGYLEGEIRLDRSAEVEIAVVVERPTPVLPLRFL